MAICECGFSLLNNIKTEKRNKLNTQTTDMLLRIKLHGPSANEFDPNAAIELWWNSSIRRTRKLEAEVDNDRKSEISVSESPEHIHKKRKVNIVELDSDVEIGSSDSE